jgi:protein disulfide-isomerase A6
MKSSLSICLLSLLAGVYASNVLDLDPNNFENTIGQGKPGLVELYAAHSDLLRIVFDATPASHPGGTSLFFRCANALLDSPSDQRTLQGKILLKTVLITVVHLYATQSLAPTYEQLADAFSHARDKVIVAKVDADGEGKPLGQKYGVTGFPSAWSS